MRVRSVPRGEPVVRHEAIRADQPGGGVRIAGPCSRQSKRSLYNVRDHLGHRSAPSDQCVAVSQGQDGSAHPAPRLGPGQVHGTRREQAGRGRRGVQPLALVPEGGVLVPRALPAESVAVDELAVTADLQLLDDAVELVMLGLRTDPPVTARRPDVAPDQSGVALELQARPLEVAAAAERDVRTRQEDEL